MCPFQMGLSHSALQTFFVHKYFHLFTCKDTVIQEAKSRALLRIKSPGTELFLESSPLLPAPEVTPLPWHPIHFSLACSGLYSMHRSALWLVFPSRGAPWEADHPHP